MRTLILPVFYFCKNKFTGKKYLKSSGEVPFRSYLCNNAFAKWNLKNLQNLPTFFQEKIQGQDIRVHVFDDHLWTLQVTAKDCIDYRYASKGKINYRSTDLPKEIKKFCKSIAEVECNRFIGVDLIKDGGSYYCLESNPGPGWSTYHHFSKKNFAKKIFKQLKETV